MVESNLTIKNALQGTLVQTLCKQSKQVTAMMVIYLVTRANDLFNMKNKLNDAQISALAFDLMDYFLQETIEDLVLLFKMARQGKLGSKIYRLDSQVIFQEWIPTYLDLKYQEKEEQLRATTNTENQANSTSWSKDSKSKISALVKETVKKSNLKREKERKPISEKILQNSDEFIKFLKMEVLKMSKKSLKTVYLEYVKKKVPSEYLEILQEEIAARE